MTRKKQKKRMSEQELDAAYYCGKNCGWNDAYAEIRKFLRENSNATYEQMVEFTAGKRKAM